MEEGKALDKAPAISLPHHHHMNFSLVDLPPEILWDIVNHVAEQKDTRPPSPFRFPTSKPAMTTVKHPIAPLRSTCKYLANICAPRLFSTITNARKAETIVNLLDYLTNIGCFVKHFNLHLYGMDDQILAEVVNRCSGLRCLTIHHYTGDNLVPVQLLAALKALPALTDLSFNELHSFRWESLRTEDVVDTMFKPLLQCHGDKLRSLKILGYGMLLNGGFASLTHDAPRLVELEIYRTLHVGLRHLFAESSTWACADHLQSLSFTRCGGLHANIFTRKLASGVLGHPRRVSLAICGDPSDDRNPPGPIEWTIPALDTFELDHFATWEMEHLQLIHAKKLFLSRVWRQGPDGMYKMVIQQIADKRAFPEAVEVHVTNDWSDEDFRALQSVCSARGVRLIMRDWETMSL